MSGEMFFPLKMLHVDEQTQPTLHKQAIIHDACAVAIVNVTKCPMLN